MPQRVEGGKEAESPCSSRDLRAPLHVADPTSPAPSPSAGQTLGLGCVPSWDQRQASAPYRPGRGNKNGHRVHSILAHGAQLVLRIRLVLVALPHLALTTAHSLDFRLQPETQRPQPCGHGAAPTVVGGQIIYTLCVCLPVYIRLYRHVHKCTHTHTRMLRYTCIYVHVCL